MNQRNPRWSRQSGMTLVELMMAVLIFGMVLVVLNGVFFSTNRLYGNTSVRAGQQMNSRAGLSVMVTELRTAGCDSAQVGIAPFVSADVQSAHIQSDYDNNRVITTAEPSEDVTYSYDNNQQAILRDPGTGPQVIIRDVSAFQFTYFDANGAPMATPVAAGQLSQIRSIGIALTTHTRRGGDVTTNTLVSLRMND
jgi:prepilin-type N-terminal cleavage/methylation domain-containing protein